MELNETIKKAVLEEIGSLRRLIFLDVFARRNHEILDLLYNQGITPSISLWFI